VRASESPFPCSWDSFDLENAGLCKLRGRSGTYGRYDFWALPPLTFELNGDWNWLRRNEPVERNIAEDRGYLPKGTPPLIDRLKSGARCTSVCDARGGRAAAGQFVRFFSEAALASRMRSNTDYFVDVSPGLAKAPAGEGHLVRFLADSQGVCFGISTSLRTAIMRFCRRGIFTAPLRKKRNTTGATTMTCDGANRTPFRLWRNG